MAASQPSRLTRRTVLVGAAAALAAGAGAPRAAASPGAAQIRSATARSGDLLALCAEGELAESYAIRPFTVDADQVVALGEPLPIALPSGFHPHSMAASGDTLWVSGAIDELVKTVTVDNRPDAIPERYLGLVDPDDADPALPCGIVDLDVYRARPALVRVTGDGAEYVDLAVPDRIGSGVATALAPLDGAIAVAIEGCPSSEAALLTRAHLAVSTDDGRTWTDSVIASGLGEGYGTVLAAAAGTLYAVTADGTGHQTVHTGVVAEALELLDDRPDAGRPMAAVATAEGGVRVFSDQDGSFSESHYGARTPESLNTECGCAGEVVAVAGLPGAWLETDESATRAKGTG